MEKTKKKVVRGITVTYFHGNKTMAILFAAILLALSFLCVTKVKVKQMILKENIKKYEYVMEKIKKNNTKVIEENGI